MVVFVNCMCRADFSRVTCCLSSGTKWPVGIRRFCDLSLARVRAGNVTCHVAYAVDRARGMVFTSRRRTRSWTNPLSCSAAALQWSNEYIFVDFATGTCCILEIVGIAGIILTFKGPANLFGLVGLYSYGLYLIHQPYVIWLGLRIREAPIWMFLLIASQLWPCSVLGECF